jgi:RES domain-containing protein
MVGSRRNPDDLAVDHVTESELPSNWATLDPSGQSATRAIGDRWIAAGRSVVLSVPSVITGERNYALNPTHPAFGRIAFAAPILSTSICAWCGRLRYLGTV